MRIYVYIYIYGSVLFIYILFDKRYFLDSFDLLWQMQEVRPKSQKVSLY